MKIGAFITNPGNKQRAIWRTWWNWRRRSQSLDFSQTAAAQVASRRRTQVLHGSAICKAENKSGVGLARTQREQGGNGTIQVRVAASSWVNLTIRMARLHAEIAWMPCHSPGNTAEDHRYVTRKQRLTSQFADSSMRDYLLSLDELHKLFDL